MFLKTNNLLQQNSMHTNRQDEIDTNCARQSFGRTNYNNQKPYTVSRVRYLQIVASLTVLVEQQIVRLSACTDWQKLLLLHFGRSQLTFHSKQ
jgi:hypothetical protein